MIRRDEVMVRLYGIPPTREDPDKRPIMLAVEYVADDDEIRWRTSRKGCQETEEGSFYLSTSLPFRVFCNGTIVFDLNGGLDDKSVRYAESMDDPKRVMVQYNTGVAINYNKLNKVYKIAEPLPLEILEVEKMDKSPIDGDFVEWAKGIPELSPGWMNYLKGGRINEKAAA